MILYMFNNDGDCFNTDSVRSLRRKLCRVYECTDECMDVGMRVKELCLMRDGIFLSVLGLLC